MRDRLSVSLANERVPIPLEFLLQFEVIFDDAVMNNYQPALTIDMRMGVLFGRSPVRRPSGMSQAVVPVGGLQIEGLFKVCQFPG